ncbi:MAG: L-lactate dehydrogenase [Oscillospiraceae bacterium]
MENRQVKIAILGAGNVGASIAFTLTVSGLASELVLVDINKEKAEGEAMDIIQGTAFCPPTNIYAGDTSAIKGADIVVVTLGLARKPGQSRIDLAQANVDIVKSIMPEIVSYAPNALYVVVSNPVDILTYVIQKVTGLPSSQVIGSGTMLDTSRLRSRLASHVGLSPKNVHAYVLGEHGDTSVIPWSLASIAGLSINEYCSVSSKTGSRCDITGLAEIEHDVRTSGAEVIRRKGATFYAVALSVRRICESLLTGTRSVLTVSSMLNGEYGINDVCLSIPFVVNSGGIQDSVPPPLTKEEEALLHASANSLKEVIQSLNI